MEGGNQPGPFEDFEELLNLTLTPFTTSTTSTTTTGTTISTSTSATLRTPSSLRNPTKEEILRAVQSVEVLQSGKQEWKLFFSQAKQVLTPDEQTTVKQKRRRALGMIYAHSARTKTKTKRVKNDNQLSLVTEQNHTLTETVEELTVANADLRRQLEQLKSQLQLRR